MIKRTKTFNYILVMCSFLALFSCVQDQKDTTPWKSLFNGKDLDGWVIKGGEALYEAKNNMIVGTTAANTPNTFLTTKEFYGDFILELELKVDTTMNSGIQFRSNSFPYYMDGRVHGYQMEVDPSKRAWSGGIYDEARRKWLVSLKDNETAQQAFNKNGWNTYRIEAIGDTIKTWVNSIPTSFLIDNMTATGFIGLQVHSIHGDQKQGTDIMWRNIRILTDSLSNYRRKSLLNPVVTKNYLTRDQQKN